MTSLFGVVLWFVIIYMFFFMGNDDKKPPESKTKTIYHDYEIIDGVVVYKKGIDITV